MPTPYDPPRGRLDPSLSQPAPPAGTRGPSSAYTWIAVGWIAWFLALHARPFSPLLSAATVAALLVTVAVLYRLQREARTRSFGASLACMLALSMWLSATWRAVCADVSLATPGTDTHAAAQFAAAAANGLAHAAVICVLFALPLGLVFPRVSWLLCGLVALAMATDWAPRIFDAADGLPHRFASVLDVLAVAVVLPLVVRRMFPERDPVADIGALPADDDGLRLGRGDPAWRATAGDEAWHCEDRPFFEFLCATAPRRWSAITRQLRIDLVHPKAQVLIVGGLGGLALGAFLRGPYLLMLGGWLLGIYIVMLGSTLRALVGAPVRFGKIGALAGPHTLFAHLSIARARYDDGTSIAVCLPRDVAEDLLREHGALVAAILHTPRGPFSRVLAVRGLS